MGSGRSPGPDELEPSIKFDVTRRIGAGSNVELTRLEDCDARVDYGERMRVGQGDLVWSKTAGITAIHSSPLWTHFGMALIASPPCKL